MNSLQNLLRPASASESCLNSLQHPLQSNECQIVTASCNKLQSVVRLSCIAEQCWAMESNEDNPCELFHASKRNKGSNCICCDLDFTSLFVISIIPNHVRNELKNIKLSFQSSDCVQPNTGVYVQITPGVTWNRLYAIQTTNLVEDKNRRVDKR